MNPSTEVLETPQREEQAGPRELFVPQVEDESLPAGEVLQDQRDARKPEDAAPLFVP